MSEPTETADAQLADVVDLVASDPETADVEQIRQVALFAQSVLHRRRTGGSR